MTSLVLDIGNTSTSIGYYRHGVARGVQRCRSLFQNREEALPILTARPVEAVIIASVVPLANSRWEEVIKSAGLPVPRFVSCKLNLGVALDYPCPEQIGADRLANAAAAARLFGTPCVVCDCGTALTFDILEEKRGYVGGIICPGIPLIFDYLAEKTAMLPHITPAETQATVGRSTTEAIQIGARLNFRGTVLEIIRSLKQRTGRRNLPVCCTGGYAQWLCKTADISAHIDPDLTLKGIGLIGDLNH